MTVLTWEVREYSGHHGDHQYRVTFLGIAWSAFVTYNPHCTVRYLGDFGTAAEAQAEVALYLAEQHELGGEEAA